MEYLMTYSWAILILAVVLGALFTLGLFSPNSFLNTQCLLPAGLQCQSAFLASNGMLSLSLLQATTQPINVTYLGCNSVDGIPIMYPANIGVNSGTNQIKLQIGSNYTFSVECYLSGTGNFIGTPGSSFVGYLFINYTELGTGFPHTAVGQITAKVT
jgi:hypothetical protein